MCVYASVDIEVNVLVWVFSGRIRMRLMTKRDAISQQWRALIHAEHFSFDVHLESLLFLFLVVVIKSEVDNFFVEFFTMNMKYDDNLMSH